jgi:hypothetical protein
MPVTLAAVPLTPRKATVRGQALTLILEDRLIRAAQAGRKAKVLGVIPSLMLPLLLLLALSAGAQSAPQCREANDQAIAAFKATLPEMSEHDRAGAEALIDELERLIKESRAQGVDECVIWQEINRRVWRS